MSILKYILIVAIFFTAGIIYSLQVPRFKKWLLNEIQIASRKKTSLEIKGSNIEFQFLPPGLIISDIKIKPLGKLTQVLSPSSIDAIEISVNTISLLAGRFEIGKILLIHPSANLFFKKNQRDLIPKPKQEITIPWDQIMGIPIRAVEILNANIKARIDDIDFVLLTQDLSINVEKTTTAAKLEVFIPHLLLKRPGKENPMEFGFSTRIVLEKDAIEISALKINQERNFLIARGVARGAINNLTWSMLNGRTLAHLDLAEITPVLKALVPKSILPDLGGILNFEILARHQRGSEPLISGEIDTKDTRVGKLNLGNIYSKLKYTSGTLSASELKASTQAGDVRIEDLVLKTDQNMKFSLRVLLEKIELHDLLAKVLAMKEPPLHMDINGRIPCDGELKPEIHLDCAGEAMGENFRVFTKLTSKNPNKTVVALQKFKVTSTFSVNKSKIAFPKALIAIGDSVGDATGEVDFDSGFLFNFHTNSLNFKDVQSLADLKYDGSIAITGQTKGDGDSGIIDARIQSDDFWFEDFGLGNTSFGLLYEKDHLNFSQIAGRLKASNYNGKVSVDIGDEDHKATIQAHLILPNLNLVDLATVFSRKVKLPFSVDGVGSGEIEASGPVNLSELTYKVKTNIKSGKVGQEIIKDLHFNVHGTKGHAFADDVSVKKGLGAFQLTGDVMPSGIMDLLVVSKNSHLTDFEVIRDMFNGVEGNLLLNMSLKDKILHPSVEVTSSLTQTSINQLPMDDSDFLLSMSSSMLKANVQLFAKKIKSSLIYSFTENGPFSFKFDTSEYDFSTLLGIAGSKGIKKDYETSLTAHVDLSARGGGFWQSTGLAAIQKFYVRRGTTQMKNIKPINIRFNDGLVEVENLRIQGDNTDFSVTGNKSRKEILNFGINGRIDLSLFTFLTPFLKDMSGILTLSTQVGGKTSHPDLLGSGFISKGYFKLDAFPHPFENFNADFLFSQSRVVINRIKATLAGGDLTAAGSILFNSIGDVPVELNGDLTGTTLAIPEGLTTRGNAHFSILGNWFPYILKGDYSVDSGLYTKNFGAENSEGTLKRSIYLPKIISKKDFSPVELEIDVQFAKSIAVKNNLMDAEIRGAVQIRGEPAHPTIKGEINALPNGKIFFRETPFSISTAKLKLDTLGDNNSTVYTVGTTRVRDWDIFLLVQGKLKDPKITLTSSPPLAEQSIVSLLALGLTGDKIDNTKTSDALNLQASQAGSALLSENPLQKELKRKLGVNVRLSQTVDDTRNVVTPRVVAEKQWTPEISTSFSRTIGDRVSRNVNVEYRLDKHFSVLGSYEGRDFDNLATSNAANTTAISSDIFGLDLQYQLEYK